MALENYVVREIEYWPSDGLTGRRKIFTDAREIHAGNVRDVLEKALSPHFKNAAEERYLWDYYRGKQDIRAKTKVVRESINNKVTVNRASEIVAFKTSYLLNEPVQYVSHGGDDAVSGNVNRLNEYMRAEDKESKDKEIVDWMHICGVSVRFVQPDRDGERDGAPFYIHTIDPWDAFVIYSARAGHKAMAGVLLQTDEDGVRYADVYTDTQCFTVKGDSVTAEGHILGGIPIVEYVNNHARMGAFEPVISILNNINVLESNAVDGIQDYVNGFDVFSNCEITDDGYTSLAAGGKYVKVRTVTPGMEAKVYRIASELSQSGVQTRIDDLTDAYLEICGMPNRNGGSSTSDTGAAVIYRDGFVAAYSRAKDTATLFKRSERVFDRIVLNICDDIRLTLADFDVKFPFGNLTNLQSLAQTFTELLNNPYVHPKTAYEVGSALFKDGEEAYRLGMEWHEEQRRAEEEAIEKELDDARDEALRAGGQGDSDPEQEDAAAQ